MSFQLLSHSIQKSISYTHILNPKSSSLATRNTQPEESQEQLSADAAELHGLIVAFSNHYQIIQYRECVHRPSIFEQADWMVLFTYRCLDTAVFV